MSNTAFSKEQFSAIYPDGVGRHYWNHSRNRVIRRFLERNRLQQSKILEIGCGRGVVLTHLISHHMDCTGVELGDALPLPGCEGRIFTNQDAFLLPASVRESIETILLFDVIEHIENPGEFIEKIRTRYKNARYLVATVPARQELWTNYDEYNGHFRRFNLADMRTLVSNPVQLKKAAYFYHVLYIPFWMFIRFSKNRSTSIKAPAGPGKLFHNLLSLILQADYYLFPGWFPGTSVIALFSLRD